MALEPRQQTGVLFLLTCLVALAHRMGPAILRLPEEVYPLPKIGLLSDSHGRAATTRRAVQVLMDAGASSLLHMGDIGSMEVIDELVLPPDASGKAIDVRLVFGNVDWDRASMSRYAQHLGITVADPVGRLTLPAVIGRAAGQASPRELIFLHGDDSEAMVKAMASHPAYLCHGHSHQARNERIGATRIINPGALFRAQSYSVAILDTDADEVKFFPVE